MVLYFSGFWAEKKHPQHTECLDLLLKLAVCLSSTPHCLEQASILMAH